MFLAIVIFLCLLFLADAVLIFSCVTAASRADRRAKRATRRWFAKLAGVNGVVR